MIAHDAYPAEQTILLVDNRPVRVDTLADHLRRERYRVLVTGDGPTAVLLATTAPPDLVILNMLLPGMVGVEVRRALRHIGPTPILLLGDRRGKLDPAWNFPLGAHDYVARPVNLGDLLARVGAILAAPDAPGASGIPPAASSAAPIAAGADLPALPALAPRRAWAGEAEPVPPTLISGDLVIDLSAHTVTRAGQPVPLKPQEFDLLAFLAQHPGRVFSRGVLLQRVWGHDPAGSLRTVDVHVHWLRVKLEPVPDTPQIIQTVHGVGYRFSRPVQTR